MPNRSIDTMDLALKLGIETNGFELHTAGGDAFLAALIFLRLLRIAKASDL